MTRAYDPSRGFVAAGLNGRTWGYEDQELTPG